MPCTFRIRRTISVYDHIVVNSLNVYRLLYTAKVQSLPLLRPLLNNVCEMNDKVPGPRHSESWEPKRKSSLCYYGDCSYFSVYKVLFYTHIQPSYRVDRLFFISKL